MNTKPDYLADDVMSEAFALVFRSSRLGLCIVDEHYRYVEVNSAWCEMLGYSRDELLQSTFLDVTNPADRGADRDLSAQLFAGEIPYFELEKRWVRKDGSTFAGRLVASVLHKEDSAPWGIAIIEANERPALDHATTVPRGVAHDLNNLLTAIRGSAVRLQDGQGGSKELEVIEEAVERAATLSRSLLAAGHPGDRGRSVAVVNDVVQRLRPVLEGLLPEDIVFESALDPNDPAVPLLPIQVDQLLMNLILNSRDAMPSGGRVRVSLVSGPESVELSVADDGEGMSPEMHQRIFEPFFTTKPTGRGTGLGLAIVQSIVEQAGGAIEVESALDVGTTISIRLPRCG